MTATDVTNLINKCNKYCAKIGSILIHTGEIEVQFIRLSSIRLLKLNNANFSIQL